MKPMATTSWATSMDSEFSPALPSASDRSRRRMLEARAPRDSRILAPSSATERQGGGQVAQLVDAQLGAQPAQGRPGRVPAQPGDIEGVADAEHGGIVGEA